MVPQSPPPLPAQTAPAQMNEFQRLIGVFLSPGQAFADIARRPRWWIPLLLIGIASTVFINAYSSRVGWERLIRQTIEQSSRADSMTAQQREQAIRAGATVAKFAGYGAVVGTAFSIFLTAAFLIFMVNVLMGADIKFNGMMGIVAYAFLPQVLVVALSMLVLFLKSPDDFDLRNPLLFNAGAFLPSGSAAWIKALAGSFDLFSFWIMALIAAGISAAAPKIRWASAFAAVLFPWALFVALRTAYTYAFA